jgi:hypothetical protein
MLYFVIDFEAAQAIIPAVTHMLVIIEGNQQYCFPSYFSTMFVFFFFIQGKSAGSEIETINVINFLQSKIGSWDMYMSFHSYGQWWL